MADGTHHQSGPALNETLPARLWARCRCGAEAEVDPAGSLALGLGSVALERLEDRLRCLCGARRVAVTACADLPAPVARRGIYVFR